MIGSERKDVRYSGDQVFLLDNISKDYADGKITVGCALVRTFLPFEKLLLVSNPQDSLGGIQ